MAYLIIFLICFLYYGSAAYTFYLCNGVQFLQHLKKRDLLLCQLLLAIFVFFSAYLLHFEDTVYYWDNGAYWYSTLNLSSVLFSNPAQAFKNLYFSINYDEYNTLLCFLIAFPLKIFGGGYFAFVILTIVLFYLPTIFMISFLLFKINERYKLSNIRFPIFLVAVTLFPIGLFPILDGYIDVAAMLPLVLSYLLLVDRNFSRISVRKDLLLGFSLMFVLLLRRYYAYAVIGTVVFGALYWLFNDISSFRVEDLKTKLTDAFISILLPVTVLFGFFSVFLMKSVFNNHLSAYSAYKANTYLKEWILFAKYFGTSFVLLVLIGTLLCITQKGIRHLYLCFIADIAVTCLMFFRIQDMGEQHYYIVLLPMICLAVMASILLIQTLKGNGILHRTAQVLVALIFILNFSTAVNLTPSIPHDLRVSRTFYPKIRYDKQTLQELEDHLGNLDQEGHQGVYCIASSGVLNSDILGKLNAPDMDLPFINLNPSQVDLRDGFNTDFFDANVLLTTDPVQLHLHDGQLVISELNQIFAKKNVFSAHYVPEQSYTLDGDVTVTIWLKETELDADAYHYVLDIFQSAYPDYPALFSNRITAYIESHAM